MLARRAYLLDWPAANNPIQSDAGSGIGFFYAGCVRPGMQHK